MAVLANVKVRNQEANQSVVKYFGEIGVAVLASVKVRNLKANHSCLATTL